MISKRKLLRQTSHPTSNPDNKVTSNPSKLLITSLPQKDCDVQDPPEALYMDQPFLSESYIEMLSCGANMRNMSSNLACNLFFFFFFFFFVDINSCPIPPSGLKPIVNAYILKKWHAKSILWYKTSLGPYYLHPHSTVSHKLLLIVEDPPSCPLCQSPISLKHILMNCDNFSRILMKRMK